MARSDDKRGSKTPNRRPAASSEEMLKEAWRSMGRGDSGEAIEESRGGRDLETTRAETPRDGTASRRSSAADIARSLERETARRRAGARPQASTPPPPPPRRTEPAPPPPPRPRRTEPIAPPPLRPTQSGTPTATPRSRPSDTGKRAVISAIAVLLALGGLVSGLLSTSESQPDISISSPDPSIDFSDLTVTTTLTFAPGETPITDLAPGACISTLPNEAEIDTVAAVPCEEEHQYELFANVELGTADEYPGAVDIFDMSGIACVAAFPDYVGEDYASSVWYVKPLPPTEEAWTAGGDRTVGCLLYRWSDDSPDIEYVTGSAYQTGTG